MRFRENRLSARRDLRARGDDGNIPERAAEVSRRRTTPLPDPAAAPEETAPPADESPRAARVALAALAVLFVGTGATALLAEQAFEKLLSTLIGASTPAAAVVLATYFAGLTLGGYLYGKLPPRARANPLRTYAVLEAIVAVWALLLWLFFDELITLFVPLLAAGRDSFWVAQALRGVVSACWILPATIPMGASFPAIVDGLERLRSAGGRRAISRFYSWNLLGAILGAVAGPFVLFPLAGVGGALLFTFAVDSTVALVAFALGRSVTRSGAGRAPLEAAAAAPGAGRGTTLLLALAFGSGFVFFSLEVVWTHLIGAVLGNSVYAFAAMLAAVLIGLAAGGLLTTLRMRRSEHVPAGELGALLFASAIVLAIASSQWPVVPDVLAFLGNNARSFLAAELTRWFLAVMLIVPPATFLGAVYPTLFRLEAFPLRGSGPMVGRIVAANALGCIVGALVTGFGLIPAIGSEVSLRLLIGVIVALGVAVARGFWRRPDGRRALLLGVGALALAVFLPRWDRLRLTSGKHVYFAPHEVFPASELKFFHEDTLGGITTVVDNPAGVKPRPYRTLLTNGKFQGNDDWEMDAQTGFALVPMQFVPRFERALVIGLGTGRTAHIVETLGFEAVDVNEIAPGIVHAARDWFPHINGKVLDAENVRLILEDGRNSLLLRPERYDLITIEISSIWFAGATNLFSREFYALVRRRLQPDGVFQQWLQLHHIGEGEVATVLATLRNEFPEVSFWVVGGQGLLVASKVPQRMQKAYFDRVGPNVSRLDWSDAEAGDRLKVLASSRILAPADVTRLTGLRRPILNTDRNRRLEYYTPRYNHIPTDMKRGNLRALAALASFPPPEVDPAASGPLAEACRGIGRTDYLRSLGLRWNANGIWAVVDGP